MAIVKVPTNRQLEKHFEPYAIELGKLTYAWNRLHEQMARLFWTVSGVKNGAVPFAIWYSTSSDRAQRAMLRAATKASDWISHDNKAIICRDIEWALARADALADKRNDALHSPYVVSVSAGGAKVMAADFSGHPRAMKLVGKDLLQEFRWYRDSAESLAAFISAIDTHLSFPTMMPDWPERPKMPKLGDPKAKGRMRS